MPLKQVQVDSIRADAAAQPREHISTDVVASYADDLARGAEFPPLTVFYDGSTYWLGDGFHRLSAMRGIKKSVPCDVRKGGLREAILFSCGANAEHGHRRSNEDKRRAVMKLLGDKEWSTWSDYEVADRAKVSKSMVAKLRAEPSLATVASDTRTFTTKHGTTAQMNVGNIGARKSHIESEQDDDDKNDAEAVRHPVFEEAGWIAPMVWEMQKYVAQMPPGSEAAERFPKRQRGSLSADSLDNTAAWFADFAAAWREIEKR